MPARSPGLAQVLSVKFINEHRARNAWDLGNDVLYELCKQHPGHKAPNEIVAKLWLIGRSYAAAIERRRDRGGLKGDAYYEERVVPIVQQSELDNLIDRVKMLDSTDLQGILAVHSKVVELFRKISDQNKPSLASKYLHFHVPTHFALYDSRASAALAKLVPGKARRSRPGNIAGVYSSFFSKLVDLRAGIRDHFQIDLDYREIDRVLLAYERKAQTGGRGVG